MNSLGFDPKTQKYKHDPNSHVPFWAATSVPKLPDATVVRPDEEQKVVIEPKDASKEYNFVGRFRSNELCGKTTVDRRPEPTPEPTGEPKDGDKDGGSAGESGDAGTDQTKPPGCQCDGSSSEGIPLSLCFLLFACVFVRKRSNS